MWLLRALSSIVFLTSIVFTIPLAFDVGGRTCGLVFSLSLASFYFVYSGLRLLAQGRSRFVLALVQIIGWSQWLVVPSLMLWSLNKFSIDSAEGWVESTLKSRLHPDPSLRDRILGREGLLETLTVGSWDKLLRWSTPVFQLGEGFCSLLVIQACGQITKWLVNGDNGDSWMVSTF
jgi:hypothetical protein